MERAHAAEVGTRLRDLRNASRESEHRITNRMIARHCQVAERTVAGWLSEEDPKGITYPHAIKCAELFDVDVRWLWDGQEQTETPDLMGQMNVSDQLAEIQEGVDELLKLVAPIAAAQALADGTPAKPEPRDRSDRARASTSRKPRAASGPAG